MTTEKDILDNALWELEQEWTKIDELLDNESTTSDTADSDEQSNESSKTEEETSEAPEEIDESLFEEKEEKETPQVSIEKKKVDREKVREATINNALLKIEDWSKSLEDFPEWVQKEVNVQLTEPEPEVKQALTRDDLRQLLQEERDEEKFKSMKKEMIDWKLSKSQQAKLAVEFKALRRHWVPKAEALEKAAKIAWIGGQDAIEKAKQTWYKRGQSSFPDTQVARREKQFIDKNILEMSADEVIKTMQKM